jgi:hypothetical protein
MILTVRCSSVLGPYIHIKLGGQSCRTTHVAYHDESIFFFFFFFFFVLLLLISGMHCCYKTMMVQIRSCNYACRYSYTFPFLDTKGMVAVDDDRVGPLYEHTFPPALAPSLSFVGIPRKVNILSFPSNVPSSLAHIIYLFGR